MLRANHFQILARNWRPRVEGVKYAEIDVVALSPQRVLWLVEVKSKTYRLAKRDLDDRFISKEQRRRLLDCYYRLSPYLRKKYRSVDISLAWVASDKHFVRFFSLFDL